MVCTIEPTLIRLVAFRGCEKITLSVSEAAPHCSLTLRVTDSFTTFSILYLN